MLKDRADVVVGTGENEHPLLNRLARELSDLPVRRPLGPVQAIRTEALKSLKLVSRGPGVSAEILVKLAAQSFRFHEVTLRSEAPRSLSEARELVATFLRYAVFANDADNAHEGYNTLERLESAPHYNAWLGSKLRPHLGRRVLEVGAGIGTLTKEIAEGRERVIALEADPYYAQRLSNLFRGSPVVQPLHAPVEETDWAALSREAWTPSFSATCSSTSRTISRRFDTSGASSLRAEGWWCWSPRCRGSSAASTRPSGITAGTPPRLSAP